MATLTNEQRRQVWAKYMERGEGGFSITKADLRAAVDGLDNYVDANEIAINQSIPQPARGALTNSQKSQLLQFVLEKRYGEGL